MENSLNGDVQLIEKVLNKILNKFYNNTFNTNYFLKIIELNETQSIDIIEINSKIFINNIKINYNYPEIELNSNKQNLNYILTILQILLLLIKEKNTVNSESGIKLIINEKEDIIINNIKNENINFKLIINSKNDFDNLSKLKIKFERLFKKL